MNFIKNKKPYDFEKKYVNGYNHGFQLIKKIPAYLSDHTQYVLHAMKENKPKDVSLQGFCAGFNHALQIEKQKRMTQIKQIEQIQTKGLKKER